jgi:hypothetical protein
VWFELNGDISTADGVLLWVCKGGNDCNRVAIVCPNPRLLRAGTGALWREWGVTIYVETPEQAEELASLIGIEADKIVEVSSIPEAQSRLG